MSGKGEMRIMDADAKFVPVSRLAFRIIGGKMRIVDHRDNKIITLNETGTEVWRLLDGRTIAEIAEVIEQSFEVTLAEATAKVASFVEHMIERGLVEPVGD